MNPYIYIGVMALVTLAVRALPLTLIRRQIKSVFLRSFLYYVPYVTLAVMTFPAIVNATQSPIAGAAALFCLRLTEPLSNGGILVSMLGGGLNIVGAVHIDHVKTVLRCHRIGVATLIFRRFFVHTITS